MFDEVDEKLQMGSAVGGIEVKSCTYCFCDLKDVGRSDAAGLTVISADPALLAVVYLCLSPAGTGDVSRLVVITDI